MSASRRCPLCTVSARASELVDHLVLQHELTEDEARDHLREEDRRRRIRTFEVQTGTHFAGWTFETFPAHDPSGRAALEAAQAWLSSSHRGLYLHGGVGTGKTGLAVAIGRHWLETYGGELVRFVNVRGFLLELRLRFANNETPDIEQETGADLLILDDLGAERPTEWAVETIATIVEYAHRGDTSAIVVTSNYSPAELATRLSPKADPVAGQRIVSRLLEDAVRIRLDRADLRARITAA